MSTTLGDDWEMVIGLEVHCELLTATKLFCGCRNAFGDEPNTNVCPVCLGLPGSLPVLNTGAVERAMAIGTALGCEIRPSSFHRKNYFYPDQPKDYQISQYDEPINTGGRLELPDGSVVGITRAHLEEDTGKTLHVGEGGRIHAADHSLVDYNRAGVPLVEIVSEPEIRTAAQARAYVAELRAVLVATGASDGRMEEGSMRVDANVSVRPAGNEVMGTRCEIKNLNSLRSLTRAIEYEADRQVALLDAGGTIDQETRHWDEEAGRTSTMRSKEEANDYRYFPEPDLVPLAPGAEWIERVAAGIPPSGAWRSPLSSTGARPLPSATRSWPSWTLGSTRSCAAPPMPGSPPRSPSPARPMRWRPTPTPLCGSNAPPSPRCSAWRRTARSRRPRPRRSSPCSSSAAAATRVGSPPSWASSRCRRARSPPPSPTSSPPTPTSGPASSRATRR